MTVLPPDGRTTRNEYDSAAIAARAEANPEVPQLVAEGVSHGFVNNVWSGRNRFIRKDYGFQVVTRNNRKVDGKRVCDIWIIYRPEEDSRS